MKKIVFVLLLIVYFYGCATFDPYKEVFKEKTSYNSRTFPAAPDSLYKAIIKTIYAQNFIIESEDSAKNMIVAKRYFQKGKRDVILLLQAKIISEDKNKSILYLNALQTTERTFVSDRTRFFLWLIPLPGGGSKEATKIKEGEKIVENAKFYKMFFEEIGKELSREKKHKGEQESTKDSKKADKKKQSIQKIEEKL